MYKNQTNTKVSKCGNHTSLVEIFGKFMRPMKKVPVYIEVVQFVIANKNKKIIKQGMHSCGENFVVCTSNKLFQKYLQKN